MLRLFGALRVGWFLFGIAASVYGHPEVDRIFTECFWGSFRDHIHSIYSRMAMPSHFLTCCFIPAVLGFTLLGRDQGRRRDRHVGEPPGSDARRSDGHLPQAL